MPLLIPSGVPDEDQLSRSRESSPKSLSEDPREFHDADDGADHASCCCGWFTREPLDLRAVWRTFRRSTQATDVKTKATIITAVVVLLGTQMSMTFGLNFFLWSFTYGSSGYVSNIAPAFCWAVLYIIPCVVYHWRKGWWPTYLWRNRDGSYLSSSTSMIPVTLCGLGFVDSLGGFTATYAAPHTPLFLQIVLQAFGVIWTFLLTRVLVPATLERPLPQLTYLSLLAFLFITISNVLAAVPHRHSLAEPSNAMWTFIFALSGLFPVVYNVLQARFLRLVDSTTGRHEYVRALEVLEHHAAATNSTSLTTLVASEHSTLLRSRVGDINSGSEAASPCPENVSITEDPSADATSTNVQADYWSVKLVMLTGDAVVQLVAIVIMFPLDFTPWFGNHPRNPDGSWTNFVKGLECITYKCENTLIYFLVYTLSFYANHYCFAVLNHISTTVTAFAAGLAFPLQLLALWWFPVLNVWGSDTPWPYCVACFIITLFSGMMYFLSEQARKQSAAATIAKRAERIVRNGRRPSATMRTDERPNN
jgi:hypothetical protein